MYRITHFKFRPVTPDYNNLGMDFEIEITEKSTIDEISPIPEHICKIPNTFINLGDIDDQVTGKCIGKKNFKPLKKYHNNLLMNHT